MKRKPNSDKRHTNNSNCIYSHLTDLRLLLVFCLLSMSNSKSDPVGIVECPCSRFENEISWELVLVVNVIQIFSFSFFDDHGHEYRSKCADDCVHQHTAMKMDQLRQNRE